MSNLERKYGKYAIKNLPLVLIICYAIGYFLQLIDRSGVLIGYMSLNPYAIFYKGQIWRFFTWVLIPPEGFSILVLIMLFFYYSISKSLDRVWGTWTFNVYIFSGMLFTIVGTIIMFLIMKFIPTNVVAQYGLENVMQAFSLGYVSTYYINMSIFLAYAATFPDASVLLMFFIPIKMKYLGYFYAGFLVLECLQGGLYKTIVVAFSLLNFIVFFLLQRKRFKGSPKARFQQAKRRHEFRSEVERSKSESFANGISKHKCAICGRTELDYPNLEFRFCSKCNGNYEYCADHLFTHKHIE